MNSNDIVVGESSYCRVRKVGVQGNLELGLSTSFKSTTLSLDYITRSGSKNSYTAVHPYWFVRSTNTRLQAKMILHFNDLYLKVMSFLPRHGVTRRVLVL